MRGEGQPRRFDISLRRLDLRLERTERRLRLPDLIRGLTLLVTQRGFRLTNLGGESRGGAAVVGGVCTQFVGAMTASGWSLRTASPSLTFNSAICPAICGLTITSLVVTIPVSTRTEG